MQPSQQAVAAMRLALDALHNTQNALLFVSGSIEQFIISNMTADAHDDADKAITALRSALADSAASSSEALAEQAEQKPVAEVVLRNQTVGFGRTEERKDIQFLADVDVGTKLYAAPVRTKDLTDENAIRASEREAIKMDILFALEKDTGAWGPDKAYNDGFNYALDLVEQEIDKRNQMIFNTPVRTKDLTDDESMKINVDTAGIVPTCDRQFHFARAVIAADRSKNGII